MGMDPSGRGCVSEAQEGMHRSTDPPALRPGKANHPPDRRKRLCNRRYSQPIRRFWHSQAGKLLLAKMVPCRTELRHVRSAALSHCGNSKTMATLSRGSQSQDPSTMRPQESRVFLNVEIALLEGNRDGLRSFHHTTSLSNTWKGKRSPQTDHQDDLITKRATKDPEHDSCQLWRQPLSVQSMISYQQLRQPRIPIPHRLT